MLHVIPVAAKSNGKRIGIGKSQVLCQIDIVLQVSEHVTDLSA